jgi:hypothetical protein
MQLKKCIVAVFENSFDLERLRIPGKSEECIAEMFRLRIGGNHKDVRSAMDLEHSAREMIPIKATLQK